jgi:hypothetical protein
MFRTMTGLDNYRDRQAVISACQRFASAGSRRYRKWLMAGCPRGLRGRIANPLFVGSNPTPAFACRASPTCSTTTRA